MKNIYYLPLLTLSMLLANTAQSKQSSLSWVINSNSTANAQADPQAKREQFPLHKAAQRGDLESINALIAQGEDVNAQDKEGKTPLHHAIKQGQEIDQEIIDALVNAGADLEIKDNQGRNPVDYAQIRAATSLLWKAIENKDLQAVKMYAEHGADVNARSGGDITPLHLAVFIGDEDVIKALQDAGADTTLKDDYGKTALEYKALLDRIKNKKQQAEEL